MAKKNQDKTVGEEFDPDDIIGHLSFYQFILWSIPCAVLMTFGINNVLSVFIQGGTGFECETCINDTNFNHVFFEKDTVVLIQSVPN